MELEKLLDDLWSTCLLSNGVKKMNAFQDLSLSNLFLSAFSDEDFASSLGRVKRALFAQLLWSWRLSNAKFSF